MPKYRERDKVRPIPGAFGLERSKEEWEKRNRPNAMFLFKTGYYSDHLRIMVEIEYGWKDYLWTFPGTVEDLVEEWKAGRIPTHVPDYRLKGEIDEVYWGVPEGDTGGREWPMSRPTLRLTETDEAIQDIRRTAPGGIGGPDGYAHIHDDDDSYLKVSYYELHGLRPEIRETIHVLDAMAAL